MFNVQKPLLWIICTEYYSQKPRTFLKSIITNTRALGSLDHSVLWGGIWRKIGIIVIPLIIFDKSKQTNLDIKHKA